MFKKIISGLTLSLSAMAAQAAVVDFQDIGAGSCAPLGVSVVSQGFKFTGNPVDAFLWGCLGGVVGGNTSNGLINANSQSIIKMTVNGGGTFSLTTFEAGNRTDSHSYYGTSTGINVLGNLNGGGTVNQIFNFNGNDFDVFTLSNLFTNLDSVTFTAIGAGGQNGALGSEFIFDNIVVNEGHGVPEPFSLALLGLGLVGLTVARRKSV